MYCVYSMWYTHIYLWIMGVAFKPKPCPLPALHSRAIPWRKISANFCYRKFLRMKFFTHVFSSHHKSSARLLLQSLVLILSSIEAQHLREWRLSLSSSLFFWRTLYSLKQGVRSSKRTPGMITLGKEKLWKWNPVLLHDIV